MLKIYKGCKCSFSYLLNYRNMKLISMLQDPYLDPVCNKGSYELDQLDAWFEQNSSTKETRYHFLYHVPMKPRLCYTMYKRLQQEYSNVLRLQNRNLLRDFSILDDSSNQLIPWSKNNEAKPVKWNRHKKVLLIY